MADHMGNVTGLVDSATGTAKRQVFDAFGNNIGGFITFQCALDHDYTDMPWYQDCRHWGCWPWMGSEWGNGWCENGGGIELVGGDPGCPIPPERQAQPVERMQTGSFNWRGGEGSITDLAAQDMQDTETGELRWSAYTRPSTGLIYMGARYYEPETGRFTQPDAVPYGMEISWGQNNRWVYCANDPVNASDPSGRVFGVDDVTLLAILFVLAVGIVWGISNRAGGGSFWAGFGGGIMAGIGILLGGWWLLLGLILGSGTRCYLNGDRGANLAVKTAIGTSSGLLGGAVGQAAGGGAGGFLCNSLTGFVSGVILGFLQWLGM